MIQSREGFFSLLSVYHMLKRFLQIGSGEAICNFPHWYSPVPRPPPSTYHSPALPLSPPPATVSSIPYSPAPSPSPHSLAPLFLSLPPPIAQSITSSFLPQRLYYQCVASGKLHPESFPGLQIGAVWARRLSRKGRGELVLHAGPYLSHVTALCRRIETCCYLPANILPHC